MSGDLEFVRACHSNASAALPDRTGLCEHTPALRSTLLSARTIETRRTTPFQVTCWQRQSPMAIGTPAWGGRPSEGGVPTVLDRPRGD